MRRFHRYVLVTMLFWFCLLLTACNLPIPSTTLPSATSTTSQAMENTGTLVVDGALRYYTWSHDGTNILKAKYVDAKFINIDYTPASRMLCFDIQMFDLDFIKSDYYLLTRKRGSTLTEEQIKFDIDTSYKTIHHCEAYDVRDEIVLVKTSTLDLNPSSSLDVMALIRVDDEYASSRKYPTSFGSFHANPSLPVVLGEKTPYVDLSYELEDPERLVESIRIEVYYREFDLVMASKDIVFTEDMYVGDVLRIEHIVFDNLSPNTEFEVYLFASGNDGVEDYENIYLVNRSAKSSIILNGSFLIHSMPSLWGTILDYEIDEATTNFRYYLDNDGRVKYQGQPMDVVFVIYDKFGNKLTEYPAVSGLNTVNIDHQYLTEFNSIRMETVQNKLILTSYQLDYGFTLCVDYYTYENNTFRFLLKPTNVDILWLRLSLKIQEDGPFIFETMLITPDPKWYSFPVSNATASSNQVYLYYTVAFIGYSGYQTLTKTPSSMYAE